MKEMPDNELQPTWYKDAVIYQLHVKSFFDGKADGIGDFVGLTKKLGYLESLGINTLWLLPFYPSPLRDDGYDIADYMDINPSYGTMNDFKKFLSEAHSRGIRVITELVLNHTSDQHKWFKKSREAKPGSYWRDFYVWSDTKERYRDARIIFKDFETSNWTWDPIANAFFWHRFFSHQPDLNFENNAVHKELFKVIDFWLGMGVDGLRLDAVPYLYEQDGTNCENLPQTFAFLKKLRAHIEERFPGRMLLAEANQWPEDAVAYFGNGDMCQMAFHFPLMPRMFMALQMEDRFPIIDIMEQTPPIPENAQWAIFLRNHDELTLEMVSEEERDFMYRSYARDLSARINLGIRRRLAPLLQNSRRRIELLNILLLSLPGAPVIYYGDEIGMGDNHFLGDRNGVRTPMQWSPDRNAGFSPVNPQQLFLPVIIDPEYHYQSVNVENEERNLSSLLWWMRRAIAMRRTFKAFSRGSMTFVKSSNTSVLSFIRRTEDEILLVIINLSRFSQSAFLDLSQFSGFDPVDMFSSNRFPRITNSPYHLTLGFHDYFWLHLKPDYHADPRTESYTLPDFKAGPRWIELFTGSSARKIAAEVLPEYLAQRTTAGCRPKPITQTSIIDQFTIKDDSFHALLLLIRVKYADNKLDTILLPLTLELEVLANAVIGDDKGLILGLVNSGSDGIIYDCTFHPKFLQALSDIVKNKRTLKGLHGELYGESIERKYTCIDEVISPVSRIVKSGKRNSCASLNETMFIKVFRRLEEGKNPEVELPKRLTCDDCSIIPRHLGSVSYKGADTIMYNIASCSDYFNHSKSLWGFALDSVIMFLEEALAKSSEKAIVQSAAIEKKNSSSSGDNSSKTTGSLFEKKVQRLGEITAQMHLGLASELDVDFKKEPFTSLYQRSLYQSFRGLTHRIFGFLESAIESNSFAPEHIEKFKNIIRLRGEIDMLFKRSVTTRITAYRTRIHGDYHLGQILFMDEQFRICDFEGNPRNTLSERRLKRSPLSDVASMIHSFFNVAHLALVNKLQIQPRDRDSLLPQTQTWALTMANIFLGSYFNSLQQTFLGISSINTTQTFLQLFLLEQSLIDFEKALQPGNQMINTLPLCLNYYLKLPVFTSLSSFQELPPGNKS